MKKNQVMKRVITITVSAAALCCAILWSMPSGGSDIDDVAQSTPAPSPATVEAAAQIAPEPSPEPTSIPEPAPLRIEKQELAFAELAPTTAMAFAELVGDNGVYEDETEIPPLPSPDTYKLVVNEYWQFATVFARDEDGEYTVPIRYMIVTTGAYDTPTPKGTFTMDDNYVRFGLFSVGVYGQYWRQITRAFYTHSLLYLHRNANTYTNSYSQLGRRGSHGCVRMLVPDARWVYYNIAPGTVCDIIRGDKHDETAKALKEQLVFPRRPGSRPGLKPGKIPVTEAWPGWQGNAYEAYQTYLASQETAEEPDAGAQG